MKILSSRPFKLFSLPLFLLWLISLSSIVQAQVGGIAPGEDLLTNPKEREIKVSARVPLSAVQTTIPEPPVLISPQNEEVLSSGKVNFVWELQEHQYDYQRLELYLDGDLLYDDIATENEENNNYRLQVDGRRYSLTLQESKTLEDGLYTWKVRVIDENEEGRNSTTWSFTVDSQLPPIIITKIDNQQWAISSEDSTTWPPDPVVVSVPQPEIISTSEANAYVQLTISWTDGRQQVLQTTTDENGAFGFVLPYLTRGQPANLSFIVVDKADNSTVFNAVDVVYQLPTVTIPVVPPFLFPDPPTITLPAWPAYKHLPPVNIPSLPEPVQKVVEPVVAPVMVWSQQLASWIENTTWLMMLLMGLLVFVYLLLLYWMTGAPWRRLYHFLRPWPRWWLRGWPVYSNYWRDAGRGWPLPGWVFAEQRYQPGSKHLMTKWRVTNLDGQWLTEPDPDYLNELSLENRRWVYPAQDLVPSLLSQLQNHEDRPVVSLTGQSWWRQKAWQLKGLRPDPNVYLLSIDEAYTLVAWSQPQRQLASWTRWLPRTALVLALALAIVWLVSAPSLQAVLWFLAVLGILLRDVQWYLPQRWLVYTKTNRGKGDEQ